MTLMMRLKRISVLDQKKANSISNSITSCHLGSKVNAETDYTNIRNADGYVKKSQHMY